MSTARMTRNSQHQVKQVGRHRDIHQYCLIIQETLSNPEDVKPDAYEQPPLPLDPREPLVRAHSHLIEISHLARQCYDEMFEHRLMYEQAYVTEQAKLAQSVAICKGLEAEIERLNQENRYYRQQLVPDYERLITSLRVENTDFEARCRAREEKSCEELEEHRKATEAMIELLAASNERLEALESVHQNTNPTPHVQIRPRHQHGGKRQAVATPEKSEPVIRHTRSKRAKRT
jgi:AraC-like DNA-binding protein